MASDSPNPDAHQSKRRLRTLDDVVVAGKTVICRVDLNVPVSDGSVTDRTRIESIVPTITEIAAKGGRPVLLSHFGRPKGEEDPRYSLKLVIPALEDALSRPVSFAEDCVGAIATETISKAEANEVVLLENTRFHPGETANDPAFARELAALGDIYCNDAFATAHRAHASTEGIAHLLPSCAGRLMQAELVALDRALTTPERPLIAIVGGSKVSTKIGLLSNLINRADTLVVGGGMANTFLAANGASVGRSLLEPDQFETAQMIQAGAIDARCRIILPVDVVTAPTLDVAVETQIVGAKHCPDDAMILDFGPASVSLVASTMSEARTLIWNGPLGAFETPPFNAATDAVARIAAAQTRARRLASIAGGGDTIAALNSNGAAEDFTYLSTAGGAFLEWMEGKTLPGVAALGTAA